MRVILSSDGRNGVQMQVNVQECGDGMSDKVYPYSVEVYIEGKKYTGCGLIRESNGIHRRKI